MRQGSWAGAAARAASTSVPGGARSRAGFRSRVAASSRRVPWATARSVATAGVAAAIRTRSWEQLWLLYSGGHPQWLSNFQSALQRITEAEPIPQEVPAPASRPPAGRTQPARQRGRRLPPADGPTSITCTVQDTGDGSLADDAHDRDGPDLWPELWFPRLDRSKPGSADAKAGISATSGGPVRCPSPDVPDPERWTRCESRCSTASPTLP